MNDFINKSQSIEKNGKLYRLNVGLLVFRKVDGKVLICKRFFDKKKTQIDYPWQFPQGGVDKGESVFDAAYRELFEEVGLSKEKVKLVDKLDNGIFYDIPSDILDKFQREGKSFYFDGQCQYWMLFEFLGKDNNINLESFPKEIEFDEWKWIDVNESIDIVVPFKKDVYREVVDRFKVIIEDNLE